MRLPLNPTDSGADLCPRDPDHRDVWGISRIDDRVHRRDALSQLLLPSARRDADHFGSRRTGWRSPPFMATAIVTSQLSGRARRRAGYGGAPARSRAPVCAQPRATALSGATAPGTAIATDIATIFGAIGSGPHVRRTDTISRGGPDDLPDVEGTLRAVARQGIVLQHTSGAIITAIRLGGAPIGSLALSGEPLSDTVVQSIAKPGRDRAREGSGRAAGDGAGRSRA